MEKQLENMQSLFSEELANITNEAELKELESRFLGKKGELKKILAGMKDLSVEEKKSI